MSNLELISFKEYPQDQYTKAVAVVCLDGKYNIAYAKKMTKDGKCWWSGASIQVTDNGQKEYVDGFSMDSIKENTKILEFIKAAEKRGGTSTSFMESSLPHSPMPTPPDYPKSMDEVAGAADGLPF